MYTQRLFPGTRTTLMMPCWIGFSRSSDTSSLGTFSVAWSPPSLLTDLSNEAPHHNQFFGSFCWHPLKFLPPLLPAATSLSPPPIHKKPYKYNHNWESWQTWTDFVTNLDTVPEWRQQFEKVNTHLIWYTLADSVGLGISQFALPDFAGGGVRETNNELTWLWMG